ncbi:MATE family efflux transporter [Jannaschia sp. W003]|uniref:MATE family efflux transporter n=1 Tax=Jannaschia sp. W003 TaxID=2867012 RepID=UPI0021A48414|nr:MATE family efflux transporter [Jannaschia sp. W003]UWQ20807.1 MATE family efflux transporter [Jannaschia sp. W003]
MTFAHHLRRTLLLGLPLVGSQLAQILIGVTDTAMLGRYSVEALAAGTLAHTVFFSLLLLCAGFAFAVMGMASDAAGRADERAVRRATRMGLWLSVLAGLVVLPPLILSAPILRALGQGEMLAADAQAYLRIAALGMVPALVSFTLRSHLSALERTRVVLWSTLLAALLNVGLNWLLIFGNAGFPELGIRGAAIASVGVQVLTTAVLALYAARGPGMARWELFRNIHRFDREVFVRVARLGWPIGLTHLSESGLFAASALLMGLLGTEALAAHGIAIQVAAATFMVHLGLSQAATVRVGRFAGGGDAVELRRAARAAALLSAGAVVLSMGVYFGAGRAIIALFIDPADPQAPVILAIGARLLIVAALFQAVDAAQIMALGMLRGLQDTHRPMIYAVVAYWLIGMPTSWLLGIEAGLGPEGVWLGLVTGLGAAAIAMTLRFVRLAPAAPAEAAA